MGDYTILDSDHGILTAMVDDHQVYFGADIVATEDGMTVATSESRGESRSVHVLMESEYLAPDSLEIQERHFLVYNLAIVLL